ncbi:GPP34 family phosphoprotein [Leifsonia sp. NPDC077715]|uniref:GOLPH3/VPS74 family protein n=1 Tax=Leifsonia sp. NPDC077715 TaxID=3155539 RepID=UPI00343AE8B6
MTLPALETLSVPEGLALLLLRDSSGRRAVELRTFSAVLGAGALAELAVRGEAHLDDEGRVCATSLGNADKDPVAAVRERIAATAAPQTDEWWVDRLGRGPLADAVLSGLVERGVLHERRPWAFLGLPGAPVHPASSTTEEQALREAVRWSLAIDHEPTPRVAATIALLDVVGCVREAAGFVPDPGLDLRTGHWPAAALQAWLLSLDPATGRALRSSIERGAGV